MVAATEQQITRPDYNRTAAGVIPIDWSAERLGPHVSINSGESPSRFQFTDDGVPYFKVEQLNAGDKYQIETPYFIKGVKTVPRGSLLFPKRGASILLNKIRILTQDSFMDTNLMTLTTSEELDNEYLYYALLHIGLWRVADTTSIPQINNKHINPLIVPIPPLPEQRAIAAALSDTDALIASLDKLIVKKRQIKQAAMQQLLTGRRRLPGFRGEWEVKHLRDVGTFSKGKGIRKDTVAATGIPCVRYGEIYTHHHDYIRSFNSFIPREVARESQLLRKGDLLIAGSGETAEEIGKCVAFLGDEEAYAGGDIVIFTPINQDSMYLGYLMNQASITEQKARMGQGDAVVHISATNLGQIRLKIPKIGEQTAIASVLSDMDVGIATLETRRHKTQALKQGMMQQLLTGSIRLI